MQKRQAKKIAKKLDELRLLCKNPTMYPTQVLECSMIPGQVSNHRVQLSEAKYIHDLGGERMVADSIDGVTYRAGYNVVYTWIDGTWFWAYFKI